jgi:threonine dehydratase
MAAVILYTYHAKLNLADIGLTRGNHAYDDLEVMAGQGTIGLELDEQAPHIDTLLVPVGGGGLLGGIAAWYGDRVHVIGVEPELCPTLAKALEASEPVDVSVGGIAVDSLGATRLGELPYEIVRRCDVGSVLVRDEAIEKARRTLWREFRQVAEPGGATALAALSSGAYTPDSEQTVGVLISGGNTDPASIER